MTFKQILDRAKYEVDRYNHRFTMNILKLTVSNKRELGQLKRAFTKYQKECQVLIDNDNFDMSEYDHYIAECEYISNVFEKALVLA